MKRFTILFLIILILCTGCTVLQPNNTSSMESSSELSSEQESSDLSSSGEEENSADSSSEYEEESAVTSSSSVSSSAVTSAKPPVTSKPLPPSSSRASVSSVKPPVSSEPPVRKEVSVTIPEGKSFMEVAAILENAGVCSTTEFYEVCQSYSPKSFTIPNDPNRCFKMEGYLFPDTYRFYQNDNPTNVLIKILNNYNSKVGSISSDTLILASIIEKEARSDEHMALVSSVFHNRLAAGMYLEADPTRDYVNKFITGNPLVSDPSRYAARIIRIKSEWGSPQDRSAIRA